MGGEDDRVSQNSARAYNNNDQPYETGNVETLESNDESRSLGVPIQNYVADSGSLANNSFSKYSNHNLQAQLVAATTHAQFMAIQRGNKNAKPYQGRFFQGLSLEDQASQSQMPEIAESVMSQDEEEDEFGVQIVKMPRKQSSQGPKLARGEIPVKQLNMTLESDLNSGRDKLHSQVNKTKESQRERQEINANKEQVGKLFANQASESNSVFQSDRQNPNSKISRKVNDEESAEPVGDSFFKESSNRGGKDNNERASVTQIVSL